MREGLVPGLTHKESYATTPQMRATQLTSDVLSSPAMISLMERTCVALLAPYLGENEQTVGFHVDVKHVAPTKIGQHVTVTVELLEVKDKKLRFAVSATHDRGAKIGEGIHRRAVIDVKQFGENPQ